MKSNRQIGSITIIALGLLAASAGMSFSAERKLAGVYVGRKAEAILKIYGEPTRIELGERILPPQQGAARTMGQGSRLGPLPPAGGPPQMNLSLAGPGPTGSASPSSGIARSGASQGPALFGPALPGPLRSPSAGQLGPLPPYPISPSQSPLGKPPAEPLQPPTQQAQEQVIRWIYELKNAFLEFTLDPTGKVLQVRVVGEKWHGVRTSRGITLGSTYRQVLQKYGFPEVHQYVGEVLIAAYPERHQLAVALLNKKVVSITVALVE